MIFIILVIVVGYLFGSIPTGYLFAKRLRGIDIRKHGSGSVGATNVFRVVGKAWGAVVLLLDALKGFAAVALAAGFLYNPKVPINIEWFCILAAFCAVAGHNWNIFLDFKGGKGIATSTGALLALMHQVTGACFVLWLIVFSATRIVSIASVVTSIALPVFAWLFKRPVELKILSVILCLLSLYKHIPNMKRLVKGQEKRLF